MSNIAFGALVSMIVLIINDVREHNVQKVLKESIRKREFAKLSNCINSFLSSYHDCENILVNDFDFIKNSFRDNTLDLEIITQNICNAYELKKWLKMKIN